MLAALALVTSAAVSASAAPVRVRFVEGAVHGFLLLREGNGDVLARGDWWQVPKADAIETHLRFRFPDGSLSHETFVFTQNRVFALRSYRLAQRGPSFPRQIEASLDTETGGYVVRHRESGEAEKVDEGRLDLPEDVYAIGMLAVLLRNLEPDEGFTSHVVVFTPEPRVVGIDVRPAGEEQFSLGGAARTARRYLVELELRGVTGLFAKLLGKDPPDLRYWMAGGPVSTFLRFEGPLYPEGPILRIELAAPRWSGPAGR